MARFRQLGTPLRLVAKNLCCKWHRQRYRKVAAECQDRDGSTFEPKSKSSDTAEHQVALAAMAVLLKVGSGGGGC